MCVFLGYLSNHRGYKCYDLSSRKIILSHHVIFYDTQFPFAKLHTPQPYTCGFMDSEPSPYMVHHLTSPSGPNQLAQQVLPNLQLAAQTTPLSGPPTPSPQLPQQQPSPSPTLTPSPPY